MPAQPLLLPFRALNILASCCRRALLGTLLLPLALRPAAAQSPAGRPAFPPQFQYLALTTIGSSDPHVAKMLLAPAPRSVAFGEVYLKAYNGYSEEANATAHQHNQERLARQLDELAANGWEVLEVHPAPYLPAAQAYSTRYLLRRARP